MESKFIRLVPFSHHGLRDKSKKIYGFDLSKMLRKLAKSRILQVEQQYLAEKVTLLGFVLTRPVSKSLKPHV